MQNLRLYPITCGAPEAFDSFSQPYRKEDGSSFGKGFDSTEVVEQDSLLISQSSMSSEQHSFGNKNNSTWL
jgi:hypothetical protein